MDLVTFFSLLYLCLFYMTILHMKTVFYLDCSFVVRVGLLYVISGLGGNLLSALFPKSTVSVGASGATLGLLGGMLSELLTNWTIQTHKVDEFLCY